MLLKHDEVHALVNFSGNLRLTAKPDILTRQGPGLAASSGFDAGNPHGDGTGRGLFDSSVSSATH